MHKYQSLRRPSNQASDNFPETATAGFRDRKIAEFGPRHGRFDSAFSSVGGQPSGKVRDSIGPVMEEIQRSALDDSLGSAAFQRRQYDSSRFDSASRPLRPQAASLRNKNASIQRNSSRQSHFRKKKLSQGSLGRHDIARAGG